MEFSYCEGCTFCLSEVNGVALEEEVFYFCWDSFCSPVLCFRAAFGGIGVWVGRYLEFGSIAVFYA